ncbi:MAG: hypothetical protein IJT18_06655 [Oscillospiraceae bacterium]|nr:hypothetical protein [Oscillospiraceae bacterium]
MWKTFDLDKPYIERKYHDPDEPFNAYRRRAYHGWTCDEATGEDDEEIRAGLEALEPEIASLPHPVAKARAIDYVLKHTRIAVSEHDYFPCFYSWNCLPNRITFKKWKAEVFDEKLPEIGELMHDMNESGACAIWPDFDHVVPDWGSLVTLGFPGIRERARQYRAKREAAQPLTDEQRAYFDGIEEEYTAVIDFVDRLYRYASEQTHEKAKLLAPSLKRLRDGAPETIFDAMQLMYLYFMISESVDFYQVRSLGNGLDHTLRPFYERDLANGTFTRDEIREFLTYFMMQWQAIGNYWGQPLYLGGTNADGNCRICDLSHDIIDMRHEAGMYNPKIQIKLNDNIPQDFLKKVLSYIRGGDSSFVFCCEPGHRRAIMAYGATAEEAQDFDLRGCYETGVRANEVSTGTGYVNPLKAVLYAMRDGWDAAYGKQIGVHTGAPETLDTYEKFRGAVLAQIAHLADLTFRCADAYDPYLSYINPSSLYSATIATSLERAYDGYQGGVKFNNSSILICGIASAVDAMMAVRELVYEEKALTIAQFNEILDANYEGHELLRRRILCSPHKYGVGDPLADACAKEIADFFSSYVQKRKNVRGGVYKATMHSAMQFVRQGKKTGASPDGRLAGQEISKNADPTVGMDLGGVTALVHSVLQLTPSDYHESFCVDLMLHPSAIQGEDGLNAMKSILDVYLHGGGMSVQFNVFDASTLRDAQAHPERYRNLQVRVCGWNVLWNNLSREEQDAYIKRASAV